MPKFFNLAIIPALLLQMYPRSLRTSTIGELESFSYSRTADVNIQLTEVAETEALASMAIGATGYIFTNTRKRNADIQHLAYESAGLQEFHAPLRNTDSGVRDSFEEEFIDVASPKRMTDLLEPYLATVDAAIQALESELVSANESIDSNFDLTAEMARREEKPGIFSKKLGLRAKRREKADVEEWLRHLANGRSILKIVADEHPMSPFFKKIAEKIQTLLCPELPLDHIFCVYKHDLQADLFGFRRRFARGQMFRLLDSGGRETRIAVVDEETWRNKFSRLATTLHEGFHVKFFPAKGVPSALAAMFHEGVTEIRTRDAIINGIQANDSETIIWTIDAMDGPNSRATSVDLDEFTKWFVKSSVYRPVVETVDWLVQDKGKDFVLSCDARANYSSVFKEEATFRWATVVGENLYKRSWVDWSVVWSLIDARLREPTSIHSIEDSLVMLLELLKKDGANSIDINSMMRAEPGFRDTMIESITHALQADVLTRENLIQWASEYGSDPSSVRNRIEELIRNRIAFEVVHYLEDEPPHWNPPTGSRKLWSWRDPAIICCIVSKRWKSFCRFHPGRGTEG